jgi:hypothetical protein
MSCVSRAQSRGSLRMKMASILRLGERLVVVVVGEGVGEPW